VNNDATGTWAMNLAAGLQAEVSMVAFGGQGYTNGGVGGVPPCLHQEMMQPQLGTKLTLLLLEISLVCLFFLFFLFLFIFLLTPFISCHVGLCVLRTW